MVFFPYWIIRNRCSNRFLLGSEDELEVEVGLLLGGGWWEVRDVRWRLEVVRPSWFLGYDDLGDDVDSILYCDCGGDCGGGYHSL